MVCALMPRQHILIRVHGFREKIRTFLVFKHIHTEDLTKHAIAGDISGSSYSKVSINFIG